MATKQRQETFAAVWMLQRMMYQEGLFRSHIQIARGGGRYRGRIIDDCVLRCDSSSGSGRRDWNCEPVIEREHRAGAIFSREGISVRFHHGVPAWMETPWGEWWCWDISAPGPAQSFAFREEEERKFLELVTIDEPLSRRTGHFHEYVIRRVGDYSVPSHEWCSMGHFSLEERVARIAEWIELCEAMTPKRYPHFAEYIAGDLPIPAGHPDHEYALERIRFQGRPNVSGPWTSYARKHYPAR